MSSSESDFSLKPFNRNGGYGYRIEESTVVIEPVYERALPFSEGLGLVRYHGKWGFIDKQGLFVIEPVYFMARPFQNGIAWVKRRRTSQWAPVNRDGAPVQKNPDDIAGPDGDSRRANG